MVKFLISDIPLAARRKISSPIVHSLIGIRPSDVFTVSFPRSGSTWLRTVLTNLIEPEAEGDPMIFNKLHPSVAIRNLPNIWTMPHPRFIQSHTVYRSNISKAVYIVRDGRDSIISFYHYYITRRGKKLSFKEWYYLYNKGWFGNPWHAHVESWLGQGKDRLGDNLLCVRFEDLKTNTFYIIQKVSDFLNISYTPDAIKTAINLASIEQGKKWENHYLGRPQTDNASFYRSGNCSQWEDYLVGNIYDVFMKKSTFALKMAGYIYEK